MIMDTATIKQSIANWQAIRQNNPKLIGYLSQGNCFDYNFPRTQSLTSSYIHAYPGIYLEKLYFFMIPSAYDNAATTNIAQYVTVCPVITGNTSNRIPQSVAKARMQLWNANYQAWVPVQTSTTNGIFKAFALETQDFEVIPTKVNFGLKAIAGAAIVNYEADLIVTNVDGTQTYYDDFARPVPPYSPSTLESSFYLMQP